MSLSKLNVGPLGFMVSYLSSHAHLNRGKGFLKGAYPSTNPMYIPNVPGINAIANQCWNNVLSGPGGAVFGWAFWPDNFSNYNIYIAQYHAVCENNGSLVDVTPHNDLYVGNEILFMADPRVCFDYHAHPLRQPPLLAHDLNAIPGSPNAFTWHAIDENMNRILLPVPVGAVDNYHLLSM